MRKLTFATVTTRYFGPVARLSAVAGKVADLIAVAACNIGRVLRFVTVLCYMTLLTTVAACLRWRTGVVGTITGEVASFAATAALDIIR
jgi:hypothetical protein